MSTTLFHCIAWVAISVFLKIVTPAPKTNASNISHSSQISSNVASLPADSANSQRTKSIDKNKMLFDEAYAYSHTPGHGPNYILAAIEEAIGVGLGAAGYYKMIEFNNRDADYTLHSSIKARLNGSAIRFDDNDFQTNLDHVTAGAVYYTIARSNGLSRFSSVLYNAIASTAWESLVEYREVISINDEINTIWGGFIIGETLHELLKIFQSGPNNFLNNSFKYVFEAIYGFNDGVAKESPYYPLDFKPDVWAKLDIYAGVYTESYSPKIIQQHGLAKNFGVDAQLIDIPMFEEPGSIDEILTDDVFTQLTLWNDTGEADFSRFALFAKTTLGAYYKKDLKVDFEDKLNGYNLFIGPSVAVDFKKENREILNENFYSVIHVLGSTLDLTQYFHNTRIRCVFDVYGDFSMMQASAFPLYAATHDISHVQSVLKNYNYYYGAGYSVNGWIKGQVGPIDVGGSIYYKNANLMPQRTRFGLNNRPITEKGGCGEWCKQIESIQLRISDQRIDSAIWVSIRPIDNLRVQFSIERSDIIGTITSWNSVHNTEIRKMLRLIYSFRSTF